MALDHTQQHHDGPKQEEEHDIEIESLYVARVIRSVSAVVSRELYGTTIASSSSSSIATTSSNSSIPTTIDFLNAIIALMRVTTNKDLLDECIMASTAIISTLTRDEILNFRSIYLDVVVTYYYYYYFVLVLIFKNFNLTGSVLCELYIKLIDSIINR